MKHDAELAYKNPSKIPAFDPYSVYSIVVLEHTRVCCVVGWVRYGETYVYELIFLSTVEGPKTLYAFHKDLTTYLKRLF